MKASAVLVCKQISNYFRKHRETKDYLLNQDCRRNFRTSFLESDGTATEEVIISFLNSGLGPSGYYSNERLKGGFTI